jgi:hypothetical protein
MTELSKGNVPAKITGRAKPTFITHGRRTILMGGRWNHDAMADHVVRRASNRWISVGELAKVGCGGNTIPNKKRVRGHLSGLFLRLADRGLFLAIEYNKEEHNSATAVKIADLKSSVDRESVSAKLRLMERRKEITTERFDKAYALVNAMAEIQG